MKLYGHRQLKLLVSAGAMFFALRITVVGADGVKDNVDITGSVLNVGGAPARFFCATGVKVQHPKPTSGGDEEDKEAAWNDAVAEATKTVKSLARSGFNMVRIPNIPIGDSGIQGAHTIPEMYEFFVSLCKANGIRVWAELMYPATVFPVAPGDAGCIDDPYTAVAWAEAVKGFDKPFEGMLSAPWDPRTEVIIQWRVREWARSFNPYTGMRRSDDPVFAVWSFEQLWFDDIERMESGTLPAFFTNSLSIAWNNWLYSNFSNDADLKAKIPDIKPGESVVTGNVEFAYASTTCTYCETNGISRDNCARRTQQRAFLKDIYSSHIERVVVPFSFLGASARNSPIFVSADSLYKTLGEHSTADVVMPFGKGGDRSKPLIMYPDTPNPSYLHIEEACYAVTNGFSVMATAYAEQPELSVFASQIFLSGTALDKEGKIDKPNLALWHGQVVPDSDDILFSASGVTITNLEFRLPLSPGETNGILRGVPENVLFSVSVWADDKNGIGMANSDNIVISAYAIDSETLETVDYSFVLSFPGLEGKKMSASAPAGGRENVHWTLSSKESTKGSPKECDVVVVVEERNGFLRFELIKGSSPVQVFFE